MYELNQLEVADSFLALHTAHGHLRPGADRATITRRYELCEDLAQHLVEYARAQHHDQGLTQHEVLRRCAAGLVSPGSDVSTPEAGWIVRRLAELEGWNDAIDITGT